MVEFSLRGIVAIGKANNICCVSNASRCYIPLAQMTSELSSAKGWGAEGQHSLFVTDTLVYLKRENCACISGEEVRVKICPNKPSSINTIDKYNIQYCVETNAMFTQYQFLGLKTALTYRCESRNAPFTNTVWIMWNGRQAHFLIWQDASSIKCSLTNSSFYIIWVERAELVSLAYNKNLMRAALVENSDWV